MPRFGQLLKHARGSRNLGDMAKLLNVHKNTLGMYERGERLPDVDFLARFAVATGEQFQPLLVARLKAGSGKELLDALRGLSGELLTDLAVSGHIRRGGWAEEGATFRHRDDLDETYLLVPKYGVQAAAGGGMLVESEQIVDYLAFNAAWVHTRLGVEAGRLALIEAVGDSMEPTIRPGDLVLVDVGVDRVVANAVYVLNVGNGLVIKRLQRLLDGTIILRSDNAAYEPERLQPADVEQLRVIGRVLWIGRSV